MADVRLVAGLRLAGVAALRDFVVADGALQLEAGREVASRVLMVDVSGQVYLLDLDAVPAEERSPEVLQGLLREFWRVGEPDGFVVTFAGLARDAARGFCVVTHDGLMAEGEGFVLRGDAIDLVPAPQELMSSGVLEALRRGVIQA